MQIHFSLANRFISNNPEFLRLLKAANCLEGKIRPDPAFDETAMGTSLFIFIYLRAPSIVYLTAFSAPTSLISPRCSCDVSKLKCGINRQQAWIGFCSLLLCSLTIAQHNSQFGANHLCYNVLLIFFFWTT